MADEWRDEKEEKQEKEEEKTYEKQEKEEKSWEEKWRRDPLGTIVWAIILIWAGLVLLAANFGFWDDLSRTLTRRMEWEIFDLGPWAVILLGAGVIMLIEVAVRMLVPEYRRPVGGSLIFAAVVIGIAVGMIWRWEVVGAFVLIGIGAGIILDGMMRRR